MHTDLVFRTVFSLHTKNEKPGFFKKPGFMFYFASTIVSFTALAGSQTGANSMPTKPL